MTLTLPVDQQPHAPSILSRGEYDPHCNFREPPTILDIGANCGVFAVWAMQRFPGCSVTCYEPVSANLEFLRENIAGTTVEIVARAVSSQAGKVKIYEGLSNCGCWSQFDIGEQNLGRFEMADTIHPADLPVCEILKVDTEGNELDILQHYVHLPCVIMAEYHRRADRLEIDQLLRERGYWLVELQSRHPDRGVVKYWRQI